MTLERARFIEKLQGDVEALRVLEDQLNLETDQATDRLDRARAELSEIKHAVPPLLAQLQTMLDAGFARLTPALVGECFSVMQEAERLILDRMSASQAVAQCKAVVTAKREQANIVRHTTWRLQTDLHLAELLDRALTRRVDYLVID